MKTFSLILFLSVSMLSKAAVYSPWIISVPGGYYGFSDTSVFKTDTLGNSIWLKDFTGRIMDTSMYKNRITGIAYDGRHLYVQEIQGVPFPVSAITDFFPAVIVLDTNGNLINIDYQDYSHSNGHYARGCAPSITHGAWFFEEYVPGFTHHTIVSRVDSSSGWKPKHTLHLLFQSYDNLKDFISLPDSTYLIVTHSWSVSPPQSYATITKMNDAGDAVWATSYYTNDMFDGFTPLCVATDPSGNIYLMSSYFYDNQLSGISALKLNSAGSVLLNKIWPDLISYSALLNYTNNELVFTNGDSTIYLDTLLNNSCLVNGTPLVFTPYSETAYSDTLYNYSYQTAFTPATGPATHITIGSPHVINNYCGILSSGNELSVNAQINIFPNPAGRILHFNINNSIDEKINVSFYDLSGRVVFCRDLFQNNFSVDVSFLQQGLYLVKIASKDFIRSEKIIIN